MNFNHRSVNGDSSAPSLSAYRAGMTNEDTTIAIWDILYLVRIPIKHMLSVEYLRHFGMPTSGVKEIDAEQNKQLITTYMSIEKMVELFKNGANILLGEKDAPKKIYDAVSKHLEAWKYQIENGVNVGDAPYDDLLALDAFANTVYEHAKYHFVAGTENSLFAQAMAKYSGFRFSTNPFASNLPSKIKERQDAGVDPLTPSIGSDQQSIPKRESMAEIFKRSLNQSVNR